MASIKSIRRFLKQLRLPKTLRRLIEKTGDINSEDAHKYTALMYISEDGFDDKIIKVLDMGANIDSVDKSNATALTHAISCKRWSTAILLLEKGADPNINFGYWLPTIRCSIKIDRKRSRC
jgi:ankyrin repeat protein